METYIKFSKDLDLREKYCLFILDSNYVDLIVDNPEENCISMLTNLFCVLYDITLDYVIIPDYDVDATLQNNLLLIKDKLVNEINSR